MLDVRLDITQGTFRLHADVSVPDGITAVFGPSGSGKSTLLAALAGLRRAEGDVRLDGALVHGPPHRRGIGLVFQKPLLLPHLTVRGNLRFAWSRADSARRRSIEEVAQFFDITALLDRGVRHLSGGEVARVALARATVRSPRLLLLDEPFAALDGARRREFIAVLLAMRDAFGMAMLVVTHQIDDAAGLAGHVVGLRDGQVASAGAFAPTVLTPAFRALLDPRDLGVALPAARLVGSSAAVGPSVWLRADHVLLAARHPEAISARNILAGKVVSITPETATSQLVEIMSDLGTILSRLTPQAVAELGLVPRGDVWALVKAHAL
jgi:molybdate transport system ATP-binding protein